MPNNSPGILTRIKTAYLADLNTKDSLQYILTGSIRTGGGILWGGSSVNWGLNWKGAYCGNEVVYLALRIYLTKFKVAPVIVSKIKDQKQLRKHQSFVKSLENPQHRLTALESKVKALEEITDPEFSLNKLFARPNSYQSGMELFESTVGHWKLQGEAFIYGVLIPLGANAGKFLELHNIPSHWVTVVYSGNYQQPIKHYTITIDGISYDVPPEQMFHIKDWNPENNYQGLSPLLPGAKIIRTDDYNKTAQARAFENGGKGYMLSPKQSDNVDAMFTKEQAELVDSKIREKLKGANNYNNIFAITRPIDINAIGDSVADMKLIEGARYNRGIIGALFGVNDVLLGNKEGGTENNVAAAYKSLVTNAVVPDQLHFMEKFRQWILKPYTGIYIQFDNTEYPELQPDLSLMKTVFGSPAISIDEGRALFNYEALQDAEQGKAILIPLGFVPLTDLLAADENIDLNNQDEY